MRGVKIHACKQAIERSNLEAPTIRLGIDTILHKLSSIASVGVLRHVIVKRSVVALFHLFLDLDFGIFAGRLVGFGVVVGFEAWLGVILGVPLRMLA